MSYDQHQIDAPLIVCVKCKRAFFVTNTKPTDAYVCTKCRHE